MPLIDYAVLRELLKEFDTLVTRPGGGPGGGRRLEDLQYTVCVYLDVRDPREAVARARGLLGVAGREP